MAVAVVVMVLGSSAAESGAEPRKPSRAELELAAAAPADGPAHGEFPVVDADGTVHTQRWQSGEVVAIDAADTSLVTVASEDGYASDYRVDPDRASGIAVGDVVTVVGLVQNPPGIDRRR